MDCVTFTTESGNHYLFSPTKKTFVPVPKSVSEEIENGEFITANCSDIVTTLKNCGYLDSSQAKFDGKITKEMIESNLVNLPQVVFEVTSVCNLRCEYCCYSSGYQTFANREHGSLTFGKAKAMLDYISSLTYDERNSSQNVPLVISFYGGEPLLNFPLIRKIVDYAHSLHFNGRSCHFSMTTNATHLYEHIDFLYENDFHILVSLDGNRRADSYRRLYNGKESFDVVLSNLEKVKREYPDFFNTLRYNAVFTDKSNTEELFTFFLDKIGKAPTISMLHESVEEAADYEMIKRMTKKMEMPNDDIAFNPNIFLEIPLHKKIVDVLTKLLNGVHTHDIDNFINEDIRLYPTGTCVPFSKRLFVSNDGSILPCEKVCRDKPLGKVKNGQVDLDIEKVASRFNNAIAKIAPVCKNCYLQLNCNQCLFMHNGHSCKNFTDKKKFSTMLSELFSYIEAHPNVYSLIRENFIVR